MHSFNKRKIIIVAILSLLITCMQILGWQLSMDYGSSAHQSVFFQEIGILTPLQCLLLFIIEWPLWGIGFYKLFHWLETRSQRSIEALPLPRFFWLYTCLFLFAIWFFFLWACFPGFYNYDAGNQLPQVMYDEVGYSAHHPLFHTLILGNIITFGYKMFGLNLTNGIFLYNLLQMLCCSICLTYSIRFVYELTKKKGFAILAFVFYAFCPPIVMLAMSTTKDILCYATLLVAFINLWKLYQAWGQGNTVSTGNWIMIGILLTLSCLFRNNNIIAIVVFALFSLLFIKKERKKQLLLYLGVLLASSCINKGLLLALDATPGSISEALCVPYQQIARLCTEVGDSAFTPEEYELLIQVITPEELDCYDPVMADHTKSNINASIDIILDNKWEYLTLWLEKGIEYPQIYIESFLYNTYQAWYPNTILVERERGLRYFDINIWQHENGTPHIQQIFDAAIAISQGAHTNYPIIRLFLSIGTMFWVSMITWFYSMWKRDNCTFCSLFLIMLLCGTILCGPVVDIRYYLILFYLFPICFGFLFQRK